MDNEILAIANRPNHLVGRKKEMETILQAIQAPGKECRVILITGKGGLGKTRILEEVLRRLAHPTVRQVYGPPLPEDNWAKLSQPTAVCDLFDFANIKLHTRTYFMGELGNPFNWNNQIKFNNFLLARDRWRRLTDYGATFTLVQDADTVAEKAFWQDYQLAALNQRLIISLDTTEQLAINSSEWLLERNLLTPKDLNFNTQQWLIEQIEAGKFINTTLIIAGREEEGAHFFSALKQATHKITLTPVLLHLNPFTIEETHAYIQALFDDLRSKDPKSTMIENIIWNLQYLLEDKDQIRVLWLFTGGQPVRLSLYTDLLIEGQTIPEPLQDSFSVAQQRTGSDGYVETDQLKEIRKQIEKGFVNLLFRVGGSLRAQTLQTLVRVPRGLTALQLHFVFSIIPGQKISNWQKNDADLQKVKETLQQLQFLSIVKQKPDGRIGLQDEVYRIYAERMLDNETDRQDEMKARQLLYGKLCAWAIYNIEQLEVEREAFIQEDLQHIRVERPSKVLSTRLPQPSPVEQKIRQEKIQALFDYRLELLHYQLLTDPETHFNDSYYYLSGQIRTIGYNETETSLFQSEMWRVISDPYALRFVDMEQREVMTKWGETPKDVLRRAAQTDDATKWITRLFIKGKDQDSAIKLADNIEQEVELLKNEREYHSWSHTLAKADRTCWRSIAQIYSGENINETIAALENTVAQLKKLSRADMKTLVFPEKQEYGFIDHPAESRLHYIIAMIYANLGFAYVSQGDYRQGVAAYTNSYKSMRELPPANITLRAMVRNNLSRALIEMGKKRSLRICEDGLHLRIKEGMLIPIALSYNTLALIYNDLRQPQEALDTSIRALAISQYVQDPRTTGLALLQVGEALRRLATSSVLQTTQRSVEDIYREGESALRQAYELFTDMNSPVSGEKPRRIEAAIELGSLYRDWVAHASDVEVPIEIVQQRQDNALYYLKEAIDLAQELGLHHLELDAQVNVSWTHFYTGNFDDALKTLHEAEKTIPGKAKFQPDQTPPNSLQHPNYYFKQLSKIQNLYGQIAGRRFWEGVDAIAKTNSHLPRHLRQKLVHENESLNSYLQEAAVAFVLAAGYAQLFAPTSIQLSIVYDDLYGFMKQMNQIEMIDFYQHEKNARQRYHVAEMEIENFGDVEEFLLDCFGDYYDETNTAVFKENL